MFHFNNCMFWNYNNAKAKGKDKCVNEAEFRGFGNLFFKFFNMSKSSPTLYFIRVKDKHSSKHNAKKFILRHKLANTYIFL